LARIFDSEKIKNRINVEIDKLGDEIEDQKVLDKLEEARTSLIKELDDNIKTIYLPNQVRQIFTYSISGFVICHDERIMWHLYNSIMQIYTIPDIQELLRMRYGEDNIPVIKKYLTNIGGIVNKIKYHLDRVQDKEWTEEEMKTEEYKEIQKQLSRLPIMTKILYNILMTILLHTSLGKNSVPTPALDMHRRQYKKIPQYEQKKMDYQNKLEQQKQQLTDNMR
jgi:hypothetical protein